MKPAKIDTSQIESMLAKLRSVAARPAGAAAELKEAGQVAPKLDFASALKARLDQVNQAQVDAENLTKRFAMGDDSVNLSDVMINSQKASIAFHATVQVRNRLVSAYQDIMNMSV